MPSYEHYRHQQSFDEHYDSEATSLDSYHHHNAMEGFEYNNAAAFNTLPFTFADIPTTYAEAPLDSKYQMIRSTSSGSAQRPYDFPPALLSSRSAGSSSSSTVGSPYSTHVNMMPVQEPFGVSNFVYPSEMPAIVSDDGYQQDFVGGSFRANVGFVEHDSKISGSFVNPVLISGAPDSYYQYAASATLSQPSQHTLSVSPAPSPTPSNHSYHVFGNTLTLGNYNTQHQQPRRRGSVSSQRSGNSPRVSLSGDEESGEKGRCPFPDCGKIFKDLKAHKLTHQSERPEKCPIVTCEYYIKGFARKYDKNRHTLTHYKGTMVCGFCPGSGSPAEKSFNRADVFKRHLTTVHHVEQNPPNSRKRSPGSSTKKLSSYCEDATGKCSTCSQSFNNAQDFYEHLDDCVLRVVQQEDPREAVNAQNLGQIVSDPAVLETMQRNNIKAEESSDYCVNDDDEDEDDEDDDTDEEEDEDESPFGRGATRPNKRCIIGGNISKKTKSKLGMTWSKGGVRLAGRGRKRRKNYPASWGASAEKMKKKKRVLCVYDGSRRLLKDDMMLFNEHEVRIRLADSDSYVTDLDIETLKRAQAFHNATREEKGEWIQEEDYLSDLMG